MDNQKRLTEPSVSMRTSTATILLLLLWRGDTFWRQINLFHWYLHKELCWVEDMKLINLSEDLTPPSLLSLSIAWIFKPTSPGCGKGSIPQHSCAIPKIIPGLWVLINTEPCPHRWNTKGKLWFSFQTFCWNRMLRSKYFYFGHVKAKFGNK